MPKLPVVTASEVIKALEKIGFQAVRQKGSHVIPFSFSVATDD